MNTAVKLRTEEYYQMARQGSLDLSHPAIVILKSYIKAGQHILDLGCGEGTRLASLVKEKGVGIDSNKNAITEAKKQFPQHQFIQADLAEIPLKDDSFDLAFSAYVFEHLDHPEIVLKSANRILKRGGILAIIAPNFGSPNRRSPNSTENALTKLIFGLINDLKDVFKKEQSSLSWTKVAPKSDKYTIDSDTVAEPYLASLIRYCRSIGFEVRESTTCWQRDRFSLFQLPFKLLAGLGIYPFYYWGPHLCLILEKRRDI